MNRERCHPVMCVTIASSFLRLCAPKFSNVPTGALELTRSLYREVGIDIDIDPSLSSLKEA